MILLWRRKKQLEQGGSSSVQLTPEARRALYKRYFAFRRGYQAGAAGLPHRVAPYEDYDQGYKLGRAAAVEISAQWLRDHGLPDPTTFPYLPLPRVDEPAFPPLPEDAETIVLTREEIELAAEVEIDLSDLAELPGIAPERRGLVTGDEISGEGLIDLHDAPSEMTLYGFPRSNLDTREFDARKLADLNPGVLQPPPLRKK